MSSWDALDQKLKDFDLDIDHDIDHAPATVVPPEASDSWDASSSMSAQPALLEEADHAADFQASLEKMIKEAEKDRPTRTPPEPILDPPTSDHSWDDLADEVIKHQESLSQLTDEAEACRSSSSDEGDADTDLANPDSARTWWARLLKEHTSQETLPDSKGQAKILSSCTGASSESFVLEAGRWCKNLKF